jgi:hypothetical protein
LHFYGLVVMLATFVVGWENPAGQEGSLCLQFQLPLVLEGGEPGCFAISLIAARPFGILEFVERIGAGPLGLDGLLLAQFRQTPGFADRQLFSRVNRSRFAAASRAAASAAARAASALAWAARRRESSWEAASASCSA